MQQKENLIYGVLIIHTLIMIDVCENNYSNIECVRKGLFTHWEWYDSVDLFSISSLAILEVPIENAWKFEGLSLDGCVGP